MPVEPIVRSIPSLGGFRHLRLGAVGSTNVEAMQHALDGDGGNLWITADSQATGKARRGRSWVSEPGNLYSSLLLIDPADGERLATLPLVVSIALYDAIIEIAPQLAYRTSIKWPNDLLIGGKKISGILLEAATLPDGRRAVVIGCGINCQHFPDNPLYPATSLKAEGISVEPHDLFDVFARTMAKALERWDHGQGFSKLREDWLAAAQGIGGQITARFSDREVSGLFERLDDDGQLVLIEANGTEHRIAAADIFFGETTN